MDIDITCVKNTAETLQKRLLDARLPAGYWQGYLSSSALSTATAVFALYIVDKKKYSNQIQKGLDWLSNNQNNDGGWGDTAESISNLSTTLLCYSAFSIEQNNPKYHNTLTKMQSWLIKCTGGLEAEAIAVALEHKYGSDKSFSVPILTMYALASGDDKKVWEYVQPLPFELSIFPHQLYKWLRLPVVSYALPALIAVGRANYYHNEPGNPFVLLIRRLTERKSLKILEKLQPENGGFLEATPLTAFVVMSLAGSGAAEHTAVTKGTDFLVKSMREDGSWPIDTNLASWVTTMSVDALAASGNLNNIISSAEQEQLLQWFLQSQHLKIHPYTHSEPGGWAWTDLPGAVPDADDTSGVLIALKNLDYINDVVLDSVEKAVKWLLQLQNSDGGMPTFCRGWAKLPFDRSSPDITSHSVAAMTVWYKLLPENIQKNMEKAFFKCMDYLRKAQRENGSWIPLWFGNQHTAEHENPVYGTAKVLINLMKMPEGFQDLSDYMYIKAIKWLLDVQNTDSGWGGDKNTVSSIEETSLAVDALAGYLLYAIQKNEDFHQENLEQAINEALTRAVNWIIEKTDSGKTLTPAPIGLYFARLWYWEKLYPNIFCLSALNKIQQIYTIGFSNSGIKSV